MANKRTNILLNLDWISIGIYLFLVIFGIVNIYSVSYSEVKPDFFDFSQRYVKQGLWMICAIVIAIAIILINSKIFIYSSYPLYILSVLILISVLIFGTKVNAAKSWFQIGEIKIQPVEFVKITVCLCVARFMSAKNFSFYRLEKLVVLFLIILTPIVSVILQNDTGSALVFFSLLFVLFREGFNQYLFFIICTVVVLFVFSLLIPINYIILTIALILIISFIVINRKTIHGKLILAFSILFVLISLTILLKENIIFPSNEYLSEQIIEKQQRLIKICILLNISLILLILLILYFVKKNRSNIYFILLLFGLNSFVLSTDYFFNHILQEHQRNRINEILGKTNDIYGNGYHLRQSKIAIASGEFNGKGFLNGTQTKYNFVPEQSTDFIFCTISEEWGFIGSTVILILFGCLIVRIIIRADKHRSSFARIYGYSIASIFFFHVAVNIGMTVGVFPIIGIPLPFLSYGGSSLWAFTILLFLFIKLDSDKISYFWE